MTGAMSCIAPKEGGTDWLSLVSMATSSNNSTHPAIYQNKKGGDACSTKENPSSTTVAVQSCSSKSSYSHADSKSTKNGSSSFTSTSRAPVQHSHLVLPEKQIDNEILIASKNCQIGKR